MPCRVASSRLEKKALALLDGEPAIDRCLVNCLRVPGVERVILATTESAEDDVLADHTLGGKVDFWRGSTDDVMSRFLGACDKYNLHTVIRVTGDCPAASWEIAGLLLENHVRSKADCTLARTFAVGTSSDVFSVAALRRIHRHFRSAMYSEYMSWYFLKNPGYFKMCTVDLPGSWIRNYRLTLDYDEDALMFSRLFQKLREQGDPADLDKIIAVLDANPEIPALNSGLPLKYRDDAELIRKLTEAVTIRGEFI